MRFVTTSWLSWVGVPNSHYLRVQNPEFQWTWFQVSSDYEQTPLQPELKGFPRVKSKTHEITVQRLTEPTGTEELRELEQRGPQMPRLGQQMPWLGGLPGAVSDKHVKGT